MRVLTKIDADVRKSMLYLIQEYIKNRNNNKDSKYMEKEQLYDLIDYSGSEYKDLIQPWERHYDSGLYKKNFFFNRLTGESEWSLPVEIELKVQKYIQ